ncbi:hypothetical protein LCGC14_2917630, partial [marine sediment metagenome]
SGPGGSEAVEYRHGGTYNSWPSQTSTKEAHANADTDNRPPFVTRVWIKRTN